MSPKRYTGSLYKRTDSPYWWGQVMVQGERHQRAFFENKAASLEEFRRWRKDLKQSRHSKSWEWYKKWFISTILSDLNSQTVDYYKLTFREADRIIRPKNLRDFTPENLSKYRETIKKEASDFKQTMQGANRKLMRLKKALVEAMKNDFAVNIKVNLLKAITTTNLKPLHVYKLWELGLFKRYATLTYKTQIFLFCRAGLRPEEGRHLLKQKINWTDKSGILDHHAESKGIIAWGPKMGHVRNFTLEDPELWQAVSALREASAQSKSPYLITNKYKEPFSDRGQLNSWKKELKRINAELEDIYSNPARINEKQELLDFLPVEYANKPPKLAGNLKDFRKTFATQLEENEHVKNEDISFLLGHKPKGVTDAHYFVKNFEKKRQIVKYLPKIP